MLMNTAMTASRVTMITPLTMSLAMANSNFGIFEYAGGKNDAEDCDTSNDAGENEAGGENDADDDDAW